ncbi:MAG: xylose isomerase [Chlamydiales bacterium]|nr:xylose isomerase [Chlamydiia bacterium]MCP5507169.1 xylose isomerase [Chlamydiales bacterium]
MTTTCATNKTEYFHEIPPIKYEGPGSSNPLAYRYYQKDKVILGKSMEEHLRLAVCFWHTFNWNGSDTFGGATFDRPWPQVAVNIDDAIERVHAAFAFMGKLGLPFFTFHDRDIAPEGSSIAESRDNLFRVVDVVAEKMNRNGIKLLWGTANLFSHRRFMAGAATNPDPDIFAYAAAQVKNALDATAQLKGCNYVLWGGREGYETLLNTNMKQEAEQLARFLAMTVDYKHKIGFQGPLLIEPKPCEPTKHQYDRDVATVFAFLQKYGLEKEFKVNIEVNHATLAGHTFYHEIVYALSNGIFGSIDANRGDPLLGWDTDQFPLDISESALALYAILKNGGFNSGGFNLDTKLRRQSIDIADMFIGHICAADTLARGLLVAEKLLARDFLEEFKGQRYRKWNDPFGKSILKGDVSLEEIATAAESIEEPIPYSGQQERLEHQLSSYLL